ncbi:hypothetical protein FVS47_RS20870, partial [Escherichia coli]
HIIGGAGENIILGTMNQVLLPLKQEHPGTRWWCSALEMVLSGGVVIIFYAICLLYSSGEFNKFLI